MPDPKPQPNHQVYLRVLRSMTPEQRLLKAMALSDFTKQLFLAGLKTRFPDRTPEEIQALARERLKLCDNWNY